MVEPAFKIGPVAAAADLEAAAGLFSAYAASLGIDLGFQGFEAELATLPGPYMPPSGILLLARDHAGVPLGCVALRSLPPDGTCEMKRLYVRPEARGLGLGRALVEAVIAQACRAGHATMRLDTLPHMHGALALYRQAGFLPCAPYYDTPLADTLFLARALAPRQAA